MEKRTPSATILYHFFHPDDVVSARHFSEFAEELAKRGWQVTVLTSNRYCRYPTQKISVKEEVWKGIRIVRSWRPAWDQAKAITRVLNTLWMMVAWSWQLWRRKKTDVIIIGSDPQFSQLLFPVLHFLRFPKVLAYWCYDLYPEAIWANGSKGMTLRIAQMLRPLIRWAYRYPDLVVDIGSCMKKRFDRYPLRARRATLTPWALIEPSKPPLPDGGHRAQLFGDARLTLLYSGNLGKAHDYSLFLNLAREVGRLDPKIAFGFACRGNRWEEFQEAVQPGDWNIHLLPFAEEAELEKRLLAADIHLMSLQTGWEGIVVPSKFFGSLAVGRPVLYAGPQQSAIAGWIRQWDLGWVLNEQNLPEVGRQILRMAREPERLQAWGQNAYRAYQQYFTKEKVMDHWDDLLRGLLSTP